MSTLSLAKLSIFAMSKVQNHMIQVWQTYNMDTTLQSGKRRAHQLSTRRCQKKPQHYHMKLNIAALVPPTVMHTHQSAKHKATRMPCMHSNLYRTNSHKEPHKGFSE